MKSSGVRRSAALFLVAASLLAYALSVTVTSADSSKIECHPREQCLDLSSCVPPRPLPVVPEDIVLVLGNTGSGKSTLVKYLSGLNQDLLSVYENNDFLITGEGIGNSITSFTKVPQLMTDNQTGIHFMDCPGFEDTRSVCYEVASTFYMKDIARRARRVKVLLLVPHFAVRKGHDRTELVALLTHAARAFPGVDQMHGSVALVVSKVEAHAKKKWHSVLPDNVVKQSIVAFLRDDVKPSLKAKAVHEERGEERQLLRLVDIFLQRDGKQNYNHLGIFRAPDEEGKLSEIQLMESGRKQLLDLVQNQLSYADVGTNDFGFSVSERTRLFVQTRSRALVEAAQAKMALLGRALADAHGSLEGGDVPATEQHLDTAAREVRQVAEYVGNSSSLQVLCDRIAASIDSTAKPGLAVISFRLADECVNLNVLQLVTEEAPVSASEIASQWAQPLYGAADELTARRDWHRLLVALYDRLNEYDQQSKRAHNETAFVPLVAANVPTFETEVTSSLGLFHQLKLPLWNVDDLNVLLARARRHPQFLCHRDGVLVVRGESVLLSEVTNKIASDFCPDRITSVEVYALNTVFVDADVHLPGSALAVVSPRWEVIGQHVIDLAGEPGAAPPGSPSAAAAGQRGADGKPGRPGRPGGHFLGVGMDSVGELRVSVRGGAGGAGQDGGPGGPTMEACKGNGFAGGDGGVGGRGGPHGTAVVTFFGQQGSVELVVEDGAQGVGGRGGQGGPHDGRAQQGATRIKRDPFTAFLLGALLAGAVVASVKTADTDTPPVYVDGPRGQDGRATADWECPDELPSAPWCDVPARTMAYFELNREHPYHKQQLLAFREVLEKDGVFKSLCKDGSHD